MNRNTQFVQCMEINLWVKYAANGCEQQKKNKNANVSNMYEQDRKKYPIETLNESHALKVKTSYVCDFFFAFSFIFTFLLLICIHSNFAAAVV